MEDYKKPLLEMRGISKKFLDVVALKNVNLFLNEKEILGVLGENGAGKSTLMNILYGYYRADSGQILINGKPVAFNAPLDAIGNGIGMVHQHFNLVEHHTVLENIILGSRRDSRHGRINFWKAEQTIKDLCIEYNLEINPRAYVWQLSVGEKQRIEILKALYRKVQVLILDEPTAVLTPQEVDGLFRTLKKMVEAGLSVIFISHKLNEVMAVTNRVVILRQGEVVTEKTTKDTTLQELAKAMIGDERVYSIECPPLNYTGFSLKIRKLTVKNDMGLVAVTDLDLEVPCGSIVGIAGVSGNGQRELAEALSGMRHIQSGTVVLDDHDITNKTPADLVRLRLARIPEDRMGFGLISDFSIAENLVLETAQSRFSRSVFLRWNYIYANASKLIKDFNIKANNSQSLAKYLSGGNIQKMLLAREMSLDPNMIVAAQPTRGLDINSTNYIHFLFTELKKRGAGVLMISEDLDEILLICDFLYVMYQGKMMGHFRACDISKTDVGLLMAGSAIMKTGQ